MLLNVKSGDTFYPQILQKLSKGNLSQEKGVHKSVPINFAGTFPTQTYIHNFENLKLCA